MAAVDLDTLWVLSHSEAANDRAFESIAGLARETGRPLRIERAAFGSPDPDRARSPDTVQHGRLVAAIVVLEPTGIDNPRLENLVRWLVAQAMEEPGFRLLIKLDGLDETTVWSLARAGHSLLSELVETIQLTEPADATTMRRTLVDHLQALRANRTAHRFRQYRDACIRGVGRFAFLLEILSVFAALWSCLALVLRVPWEWLPREPTAITLGAAVFPLISGILYVALHEGRRFRALAERRATRVWMICLGGPLAACSIHVCEKSGAGWSWISLGIVFGVLLEIARRSSRQARRKLISLARIVERRSDTWVANSLVRAAFSPPDPWRCPLLHFPGIDVFSSYAHSSRWGVEIMRRVQENLTRDGLTTFLDRRDIATGSAWPGTLGENIGQTGVFIAALDTDAMRSDWVAAEVTAALIGRAMSGFPSVIVLMDRDPMLIPDDDRRHPVFRALLNRILIADPDAPPYRVVLDPAEIGISARAVRTMIAHDSFFPPAVALPFLLAVGAASLPGLLAVPSGAVAWLVGTLQIWKRYDSASLLEAAGFLDVAYVTSGVLLGFGARSLPSARMHQSVDLFSIPVDLLMVAGFLILLGAWFPRVDPLIIGWTIAACATGFVAAEIFFKQTQRIGG